MRLRIHSEAGQEFRVKLTPMSPPAPEPPLLPLLRPVTGYLFTCKSPIPVFCAVATRTPVSLAMVS